MKHYDYAEVARVACKAIHQGRSAALAIAAEYGIEESNARHVIAKARARGFEIPYTRTGGNGAQVESQPRHSPDVVFQREPWMQYAECNNHPVELFFPGRGKDWTHAKQVCDACPVRKACLDYALRLEIKHGIFGGTSERERRVLRAERKRSMRDAEMGAA